MKFVFIRCKEMFVPLHVMPSKNCLSKQKKMVQKNNARFDPCLLHRLFYFFLSQRTIERLGVSKKARAEAGSEWGARARRAMGRRKIGKLHYNAQDFLDMWHKQGSKLTCKLTGPLVKNVSHSTSQKNFFNHQIYWLKPFFLHSVFPGFSLAKVAMNT